MSAEDNQETDVNNEKCILETERRVKGDVVGKEKDVERQKREGGRNRVTRLYRVVSNYDPVAAAIFEQKLLLSATALIFIAMILWTVSIATQFWFHVTAPNNGLIYVNRTNSFFVRSHSGIWTICKFVIYNGTASGPVVKQCHNHRVFLTEEQIQKNPEVDRTILDYTRTEVAFSVISFCLMAMGIGFSLYTFKERRYTFKRLAGAVHFISAASVLVVIEVVANSVKYEEQYLSDRHPKGAVWSYGYSYIVAWFTFILNAVCGVIFIVCSRKKKKGETDLDSGADEPHILGRL